MTLLWQHERQFGKSVGGILLLIGGYLVWRHNSPLIGPSLLATGALLVILGTVAPRVLVYPRRTWMAMAEALGFVSTRVILGLVFFVILTPMALVKRWAGSDPLGRR
ncbi:MAG TPA: hypothetical protein DIU48_07350, partial [Acidobacteria bacterium]|nr:hypothetical protein [Acidobacteriota bacterium]